MHITRRFPQPHAAQLLTGSVGVPKMFASDSLAGLAAGGLSVGTEGQCHGEATTRVAVIDARNGPQGAAAGNRTDSSAKIELAVTFTIKGTCWAASSIYSTGGAGPGASPRLPKGPKTLGYLGSKGDGHDKQKRANSARADQPPRRRAALIGLTLAGLAAGFRVYPCVVASPWHCPSVPTESPRVAVIDARNGPQGAAAGNR